MIDETRLADMMKAFGPDGFVELFAIFRDETEDIVTRLARTGGEDRFGLLHAVRGSADNMGLPILASMCRDGQARIARGAPFDPATVDRCYRQSTNALARTIGILPPY